MLKPHILHEDHLGNRYVGYEQALLQMTTYAAPLRGEIERLKSELAASVSPKLVLPSEQTSKLIQIAASLLTDRLSEDPQEWHNDRKAPKWLIKRIVRLATLYNDKNRDRSRIIKEVVDELRRLNPSLFK